MLSIVDETNRDQFPSLLKAMFTDRKRIFVDQLKWNLPVTQDRYEIDQFDDSHAVYVIASDNAHDHLGSFRLLQTDRPHILDSLFPVLCEQPIPRGPSIREVTRFCASPAVAPEQRRAMRNILISAMVDYALDKGISALTGVVTVHFLDQILAMGWDCNQLGKRVNLCDAELGAFCANVDEDTLVTLARTGIYHSDGLTTARSTQAAPTMMVYA